MSKRTRGFDGLWRWQVTDDLDMPDGSKLRVTAKRLNRMLKKEREDYAISRARKMNLALENTESKEYKERLQPLTGLSSDELLQFLEMNERIQLTARAEREFLSPSPSDKEDNFDTLKDRLDAMDVEDETMRQLDEERAAWVESSLAVNMEALKGMDRDELVKVAIRTAISGIVSEEWWSAYKDASLRLGVFIGDKPFFGDWPVEADDDLKARLLELYNDADAASFDFSI